MGGTPGSAQSNPGAFGDYSLDYSDDGVDLTFFDPLDAFADPGRAPSTFCASDHVNGILAVRALLTPMSPIDTRPTVNFLARLASCC